MTNDNTPTPKPVDAVTAAAAAYHDAWDSFHAAYWYGDAAALHAAAAAYRDAVDKARTSS